MHTLGLILFLLPLISVVIILLIVLVYRLCGIFPDKLDSEILLIHIIISIIFLIAGGALLVIYN